MVHRFGHYFHCLSYATQASDPNHLPNIPRTMSILVVGTWVHVCTRTCQDSCESTIHLQIFVCLWVDVHAFLAPNAQTQMTHALSGACACLYPCKRAHQDRCVLSQPGADDANEHFSVPEHGPLLRDIAVRVRFFSSFTSHSFSHVFRLSCVITCQLILCLSVLTRYPSHLIAHLNIHSVPRG